MTPERPRKRRWDRYRRRRQTVAAGDLVAAVLARHGIIRDLREHRVFVEWATIVGPRIARRTWPERMEGKTLWVAVESSPWLAELSFLTGDLAARVNRHIGGEPVCSEIKLALAGHRQKVPEPVARKRRPPSPRPLSAATESQLVAITDEAAAIEDPELRDIIIAARGRIGL
ncbi:MAG TPA: DUF721 domain-containing protein [Kofleriaceae bacterium]|nr:DUF721 domain-containing protein [Kofleriaceae bacterium]